MLDPEPPRTRRWPRVVGIAVLALVLLLGVAVTVLGSRVPGDSLDAAVPGGLEVADQARGEWTVGTVQVTLDEAGLRMVDTARDDLVIWQSPPDRAFVLAVLGEVGWTNAGAYVWPDVRHECELVDQQVRSATDDGGRLEISGVLTGCGEQREYTMAVLPGPSRGDIALDLSSRNVDAIGLATGRGPGAGVHGFGEQFAPFDLSGRLIPIVVREQGVGRGEQPITWLADVAFGGAGGTEAMTYAAWPSFVTGDVRGVELDPEEDFSHAFAVADTRDGDSVVLTSWSPQMSATLTADADPLALLARRGADERRPDLPEWLSAGAVVGVQGGTEQVRQVVDDLVGEGAAISAVWVQDWTGRRTIGPLSDRLWWTWQLDPDRYPGWDALVRDLNAAGIRMLTYVNPFLVDAEEKGQAGARNLFAEARDEGHLVRDPSGEVYLLDQAGFDAALVDLTSPQARDWYADVIASEVLGQGADGFMADYGDGLPFDAVLADGDPALEHNRWPVLWAQTVRDACERADKPDCLTWFRAGGAGMSAQAPMTWNGDQLVTYGAQDGMASALLGTFSAGVSGWHVTHSDIGGFTSVDARVRDYVRPDELNRRWAEMAAFGVMMRTHETNRPARNPQVYDTPESRAAFAAMTRLFAALEPYRRDVLAEAVRSGVPALRHGWLEYPGTVAAQSDTQFFFGPSVLVAPVLEEGADRVDVALPPGTWVHLLTGDEFDGGRVATVDAPLGQPAAFVRADDERRADLEAMVAGLGLGTS